MTLLLDTHVFIWMINEDRFISPKARDLMADLDNSLFLSAASYWEICIKTSIGKLELGRNWKAAIDRELEFNNVQWLPIRKNHSQGICALPGIHKDPFDRLLISQAKCEKMTLVTADKNIQKYPFKWIW
ncbi:MAG: type II toxin-antitoxin system VapC family toxin [Verrucomicrobiota bacterium]